MQNNISTQWLESICKFSQQKFQQYTAVIVPDGQLGEVWSDGGGDYVKVTIHKTHKNIDVKRENILVATPELLGLEPGDQGRIIGMRQDEVFTYESDNGNGTINVRSEDGRSMRPNLSKFELLTAT